MIEARQNLPLGAEAHAQISSLRAIDYFDCDLSRELFIGALTKEHGASAAATEH
jgi:hypothetical protein